MLILLKIVSDNREIVMAKYADDDRERAGRDTNVLRLAGLNVSLRDSDGKVLRCNCECGHCHHRASCGNLPSGTFSSEYVGDICDHCAQVMISTGGGCYVKLKEGVSV